MPSVEVESFVLDFWRAKNLGREAALFANFGGFRALEQSFLDCRPREVGSADAHGHAAFTHVSSARLSTRERGDSWQKVRVAELEPGTQNEDSGATTPNWPTLRT